MDDKLKARIKEKAHYICPECGSNDVFVYPVSDGVIMCTCIECKAGWTVGVAEILKE